MKKRFFCAVVLMLILAVCASASFTNANMSVGFDEGNILVSGSFSANSNVGEKYNVFLATYGSDGIVDKVELSKAFTVRYGSNSFSNAFPMTSDEQNVRAFVLTEKFAPVCVDVTDKVVYDYIDWKPSEESFYTEVANSKFTSKTVFSKYIKNDENVNVAEAISIAARLHALYNKKVINAIDPSEYEYLIEMDDASKFVDLSDRNSVNLDGINLTYATGGIDESKGYLYGTSTRKDNGGYDPQVVINGLSLDARHYNKITLRMKYESVAGSSTNFRNEKLQLFFKTNNDSALSESKSKVYELKKVSNIYNWFEIELDMSSLELWRDVITGIRVDPLNGNGKFYIDCVKFTKSALVDNSEWYDPYVQYAKYNGLINLEEYVGKLFDDITRQQFYDILIKCYPESFYSTKNSGIYGIADVDKNMKNAEYYLMLYRSGITLGADSSKNMKLSGTFKRSEIVGLVNRILVTSNRLSGTTGVNWANTGSPHDVEFNSSTDRYKYKYTRASSLGVSDGKLNMTSAYDSYMVYDKTFNVDAGKYKKLRIRLKPTYTTTPTKNNFEFFFMIEGMTNYSSKQSITTSVSDAYVDEFGWYTFDVSLELFPEWNGKITKYRLDLINDAGNYSIDYIRFIENEFYGLPTDHNGLVNAGYTATRLSLDEGFERGFYIAKTDQTAGVLNHGIWQDYYDGDETPLWGIGPWWQGTGDGFTMVDLWEDKDNTTDKYTLADKHGINTITYNPETKSITQRLNATKIYGGKPHDVDTYKWWPHQLLEQSTTLTGPVDRVRNSAGADRMFVEIDVRMTDFKNTTNPAGTNVCSYLVYFYLRPKEAPNQRIWFGLNLFSTSATESDPVGLYANPNLKPTWSPDSAAHQYMYGIPQAVVYGGIENSFIPKTGVAAPGSEWKKIRLDVTPHLERAVEWANRDNIFGFKVTRDDMYFDGVNIGYEIHGNYDCTFEFKNFNMVSYNK